MQGGKCAADGGNRYETERQEEDTKDGSDAETAWEKKKYTKTNMTTKLLTNEYIYIYILCFVTRRISGIPCFCKMKYSKLKLHEKEKDYTKTNTTTELLRTE